MRYLVLFSMMCFLAGCDLAGSNESELHTQTVNLSESDFTEAEPQNRFAENMRAAYSVPILDEGSIVQAEIDLPDSAVEWHALPYSDLIDNSVTLNATYSVSGDSLVVYLKQPMKLSGEDFYDAASRYDGSRVRVGVGE